MYTPHTFEDDTAIDGNPEKHYITIFMNVMIRPDSAELENLEPHKCEGWEWVNVPCKHAVRRCQLTNNSHEPFDILQIDFNDLRELHKKSPGLLFDPLARFIDEEGEAFPTRD